MPVPDESNLRVGDHEVAAMIGGDGVAVLVLHDELGYPGWLSWAATLSATRRVIMPLQPGFGRTDRVEWFVDYRDVAAFYSQLIREHDLGPVDLVGFSAGGYIAAEIAAASPELVRRLALVAPCGLRPTEGEIFDFLAVTAKTHVTMSVSRHDAPEVTDLYGGSPQITPEQFELFEAARAETTRLGWQPFMFSTSLGHRLAGVDVPSLLVWGEEDRIVPRGAITAYEKALRSATVALVPGVGHRPEVEDPERFLAAITPFLQQ